MVGPSDTPAPRNAADTQLAQFAVDFNLALARVAEPLFARAVERAAIHGITARLVADLDGVQMRYLGLCLGAEDGPEVDCYCIKADVDKLMVRHEQRLHSQAASRHFEAGLTSINETLLNTELAAFFMRSLRLRIDLLPNHKIGF